LSQCFIALHAAAFFGIDEDLIAMLLTECQAGGVERWQPCKVHSVALLQDKSTNSPCKYCARSYLINSAHGVVHSPYVVIATGGLSIPKIGATDFGQRIAQQFGHRIVPLRPALVPLTFDENQWSPFVALAGLSLPVQISAGEGKSKGQFDEDLLFTHRGLSGPAVLQISSYWREGSAVRINLCPAQNMASHLQTAKLQSRKLITNEIGQHLPHRLADTWSARDAAWQRPINEASDKALQALADSLQRWHITPNGSEGYKKAEVTAGGVDTREMSSQTMESQKSPGLYFIGEVVDVTGWLGGYNFQWAWASAHACATALAAAALAT
jgi:predicted Rossmann fold flavoprotein